ncbi:MAG TPA: phosphotyrosine protein phosphatase [Burkholderiaceae bacterium]
MNLLFICSRNQWRSPTAEHVWRRHPGVAVRSAGTSAAARRVVSAQDIAWADIVFAMEQKHKSRLAAEFGRLLEHKRVVVLDIPDDYKAMDPELIELLRDAVAPILEAEMDGG